MYNYEIRNEVNHFIRQFNGAENVFINGMCYWFAFILQTRFEIGEIIYDSVAGHFMWMFDGGAFDVEGEHELPERFETWQEIKLTDDRRYLRILRDCVFKAS